MHAIIIEVDNNITRVVVQNGLCVISDVAYSVYFLVSIFEGLNRVFTNFIDRTGTLCEMLKLPPYSLWRRNR